MQTQSTSIWGLRAVTFVLAALAAASATFWGLKWNATAPAQPSAALAFAEAPQADPQVVARLLGGGRTAAAPVEAAANRFKLIGVVADLAKGGYALIAIDGKPAKPYRVGAQLDDALVLQSVSARSAALATSVDAPASVLLELPKLNQP
ncbi:MAG: type II secretion system protein N [Rhodoferax sp.]|uniref:type II secretion system protein N n=1 Tax=Rhodoferax sp. TaxID=50421 RepID=UPI003017495E